MITVVMSRYYHKCNMGWIINYWWGILFAYPPVFKHCNGKSTIIPSGKRLHNYGKSPCYQWVNPRTKWQFSIANCWSLPEGSMRINLPGFISNAPHQASLLLILSALSREQDFSDWGSVWPWV